MTVSSERTAEAISGEQEWEAFGGVPVTLYALPGSPETESAPTTLHQAEAIVTALHKLLEPEAPAAEPIALYLVDSRTPIPARALRFDPNDDGCRAELSVENAEPIEETVRSQRAAVSLARLLTDRCVRHWQGDAAASASVFVEGLAGLALAQASLGPTTEEADQYVRAEREAGHTITLAAGPETDPEADKAAPNDRIDPAALSFVAFLSVNYGSKALHRYLSAYDPLRQDQAALTAYRQPLAVLQAEWLARLHRPANDGSLFQSFLRQVLPLLKPYRWKQIEILIYLSLAAAYNVVQPYSIKIIIDRLTQHPALARGAAGAENGFLHTLLPFLLLLLGINVLNGVVSLRRAYTVNWLNQNILNTLQIQMYAHLQRLGHNFYLKARIGDIMARLNDDLDSVQSALGQITNKALYQSFTIVGALTALFILTRKSPVLALPILCILPLFAVYYAALRTRNKQASREQRRRVGQAMADVQQHLSAHALIKAFGMEERTIADYRSRIRALQRSKLRLAVLSALTDLSEDATTALAQLVIFGVGGYLVLRDGQHGLGVGDLTALLVLTKSIFSPVASLAGIGQTIQQATGSMERVSELFQEPITICDKPEAKPLPPLTREIRLENVTFRYGGERAALRNVALAIPAGKHVAIVGSSGGGKSSIVNLLMRFWDPEEGSVRFDGNDLRDVTIASVRAQIGLVFQETFIFDTTLRENIALARPDATDTEIVAAAQAAQLDDFIRSLPAGYETIPGENGASLSVGQKQRIAIARVFLRNPRILILDEATSALDAKTEAGVLETLAELSKGRTTISITHRISQASTADWIFVMDSGRLVENGAHETLIRANGLYQKLYEEATVFAIHGPSPSPPPHENSPSTLPSAKPGGEPLSTNDTAVFQNGLWRINR